MGSLTFEALSTSNHDEVRSLILAGLAEHWGTVDEDLNPDLDDMLTSYGDGHTVVARGERGVIVGTGSIIPRSAGTMELVRMSVDSSVRRSGAGRKLVKQLLAVAREGGFGTIVLETTTSWTEVIAFYLSCGFEITHVVDGEFGSETWFKIHVSSE